MPKIIYRPFPGPPPFVPPTPVYPENSISFSPMPFNAGQNVVATLHKVTTTPEATKVNLQINSSISPTQSIIVEPVEPDYIDNLEIPFVAEHNYDPDEYAILILWNGVEWETEIELSIV